uniref:Uncharacterized protein n=1 Tax=Sus scrofa TaxID=9823 RepID=A0A8D0TJR6_PIG
LFIAKLTYANSNNHHISLKQMSKAGDGYEFRIQIKRLKEKTILLRYD